MSAQEGGAIFRLHSPKAALELVDAVRKAKSEDRQWFYFHELPVLVAYAEYLLEWMEGEAESALERDKRVAGRVAAKLPGLTTNEGE